MSFPTLTNPEFLSNATREELEALVSQVTGYLSIQHNADGSHKGITARSVAIAKTPTNTLGTLSVEGNATLSEDVSIGGTLTVDTVKPSGTTFALQTSAGTTVLQWNDTLELEVTNDKHLTIESATGIPWLKVGGAGGTGTGGIQDMAFRILRPAQLTASQNNYSPTSFANRSLIILDANGAVNITGFTAPLWDGPPKWISNKSGFAITLVHNSGSSSAGNKIICPGGVDYAIAAGGGVLIYYDFSDAFWRLLDN